MNQFLRTLLEPLLGERQQDPDRTADALPLQELGTVHGAAGSVSLRSSSSSSSSSVLLPQNDAVFLFKRQHAFVDRRALTNQLAARYPNRVPLVAEPQCEHLPALVRPKFFAPEDVTVARFLRELRNALNLHSERSLVVRYYDRNAKHWLVPPVNRTVGSLYRMHRDADGFVYVLYTCSECNQRWYACGTHAEP